jgi:hypothetical protein
MFVTFRHVLHPCCEKFVWCEAHNHLPMQPSVFRTECDLLFADPQNATLSDGGGALRICPHIGGTVLCNPAIAVSRSTSDLLPKEFLFNLFVRQLR